MTYKALAILGLLVLLSTISCTSNDLDDSASADVIMQIMQLDTPTVTANLQQATAGTCQDVNGAGSGQTCQVTSDCPQGGVLPESCVRVQACVLEVEEWTVTIFAAPKNDLALPPYNDIVMQSVDIAYQWNAGGTCSGDGMACLADANCAAGQAPCLLPNNLLTAYSAGLRNVTVPAQGSNSVRFFPIPGAAVNIPNTPFEGASASVTLTFRGITVEGTSITQVATAQVVIDVCT